MIKLLLSNVDSISNSDIVVIGFPDDSKSHAKRDSANRGPDILREAYNNSQYFERNGKKIPICSMAGNIDKKKIYDFGNTNRRDLYNIACNIFSNGKIPIILGGDHSLTTILLKAINQTLKKKVSLIYFDAHPDFVSSTKDYYGSVLSDSYESIDFKQSILVGTRAAEPEELDNIRIHNLEFVTPLEIIENNITDLVNKIISKCKDHLVYVSIDLDCIDPSIAPGVSVPAAGGISSLELIYLVKKICSDLNVIGLDIVELSPEYDIQGHTANIASRLLLETIASIPDKL